MGRLILEKPCELPSRFPANPLGVELINISLRSFVRAESAIVQHGIVWYRPYSMV